MIKRLIDILISLFALIVLMPIFMGVILAIYFTDKGPIFFKQQRVGKNGQAFDIYKFRSMVIYAEKIGGYSTSDNDPRITPIGYWIRKSSIDELPQILNVLLGDMSIVGPRPDVPAQKTLYTDSEWQLRNSVKPGITGLAQATLRSSASVEQRKALDLQYVQEISTINDFKIILMTIRQILFKGGN